MSDDSSRSYRQGARAAGIGLDAAGRAGRAAGRAGRRGAKIATRLPWQVWAVFTGIVIFLVFVSVLIGGTSSSSMDSTHYLTAEDSDEISAPENEEELESVYTKKASLDETTRLAAIIQKARAEERLALEASLRKQYADKNVTFECDTDAMPVFICDDMDGYGTPYGEDAGSSDGSPIRILMVDDDAENKRVAKRFEREGCEVTTVFDKAMIDAESYDALVIPGGSNVDPSMYGAKRSKHTSDTDKNKDELQIYAVKQFAARQKPILGLCRGMQLVNTAFGGTIDQGDGTYHKGWDEVSFDRGSWFYGIYGKELRAYHYHKQQVKDIAPGFTATAWGKKGRKKIIEGMEHQSLPIYCTQWHPDVKKMGEDGQKTFTAFVDVIRKRKGTGASYASPGTSSAPSNGKYTSPSPAIQGAIDWAVMIASDDSFSYGKKPQTSHVGCYFCGTNKKNKPKGYEKTYVCMTFVHAAFAHGAGDPELLRDCRKGHRCISETSSNFKRYTCWQKVGNAKNLKMSDLQSGDVFVLYAANNYSGHVAMYLGGNDIVDAEGIKDCWGPKSIAIRKGYGKKMLSMCARRKGSYVMRYVGPGGPTNIGSSGGASGVSQTDLDILSAYSVSLSNTELRKTADGEEQREEDSLLSGRYVDISGRRVKTYWFGDKKGRINYERDLRSRAYKAGYYESKIEITSKGGDVRITLSEKPAHKICRELFGLDPNAPYVNAYTPSQYAALKEKAGEGTEDDSKGDEKAAKTDDWNLLLVNSKNPVPEGYSPGLEVIDAKYISSGDSGDKWRNRVDSRIYESLKKMLDNCSAAVGSEKNRPLVISAYRTYDMQKALYDSTANKNDTAYPGTSEHECGLAVDIVDADYQVLGDKQADTAAQKWLMAHCQEYGFILRYPSGKESITGIIYEPWHYRYVGEEAASVIMSRGITLEEYVQEKNSEDLAAGIAEAGFDSIRRKLDESMEEGDADDALTESGYTTNAAAIYSISTNTAKVLYTGTKERSVLVSGSDLAAGGTMETFPLPKGSWQQTDYFNSKDPVRGGRRHAGVDLGAKTGTPIYAAASGYVLSAGWNGGYGKCVVMKTGSMEIYYGHMSRIDVKAGASVSAGIKIGEVGSTGNSTGPHLHFEIRLNGVAVNPAPYLGNGVS